MPKKKKFWLMNVLPKFLEQDFILFLFGFKPAVLIFVDKKEEKDVLILFKLYQNLLPYFLKNTYINYYVHEKKKGKRQVRYFIFSHKKLSYDDFLTKGKIFDHKKVGRVLGYPECCITQFLKDFNKKSKRAMIYDSAARYVKQVEKLKIRKDLFGIEIDSKGKIYSSLNIGFIPCSPKCKQALKMLKNLKKIKEFGIFK